MPAAPKRDAPTRSRGHTNLETGENERLQLGQVVVVHLNPHPVLADDDVPSVAEDNGHPETFNKRG